MKNIKVSCVILNYNDYQSTACLLDHILNYSSIDFFVIVDGASTNESYNILKKYKSQNVFILRTDKNGGYGYGNNIGIRYSKKMGADYVLIANPDVIFSDHTVSVLKETLDIHSECAIVAPRQNNTVPAWHFAKPYKDFMFSSILLNKIFRPRYYKSTFFENKKLCYVDAVPGCLLMAKIDILIQIGLYDEEIFLYQEEMIIGKKLQSRRYKTIVLLNEYYRHTCSSSVKNSFHSSIAPKIININSHIIYLKKYCHSKQLPIFLLNLLKPYLCIEIVLWNIIKQIGFGIKCNVNNMF